MHRTSHGRSICLYLGKSGGSTIIVENSEVRMYRYLDTSTKTQMNLNHGPVWKTQSFLSSEICTVILWQDYFAKGNSRKFNWNTGVEKFQIGNSCSFTQKKE